VSRAPDAHPLENPVRSSLLGPHARFTERRGNVLRYPVDVSPFVALPAEPDDADWADAAALAGPGGIVPLAGVTIPPPAGWEMVMSGAGVQLVDDWIAAAPDDEAVRLGAPDVPQVLDLATRTKPGPFLARTIELGTYLGIRRRGVLAAMAGERLHPPGWTEISAVCTDEAYRGQGSRRDWCSRWRLASGPGARRRSCTLRRPMRTRSGCMSRSGSGSAATRRFGGARAGDRAAHVSPLPTAAGVVTLARARALGAAVPPPVRIQNGAMP
jgi:hypothetical protein